MNFQNIPYFKMNQDNQSLINKENLTNQIISLLNCFRKGSSNWNILRNLCNSTNNNQINLNYSEGDEPKFNFNNYEDNFSNFITKKILQNYQNKKNLDRQHNTTPSSDISTLTLNTNSKNIIVLDNFCEKIEKDGNICDVPSKNSININNNNFDVNNPIFSNKNFDYSTITIENFSKNSDKIKRKKVRQINSTSRIWTEKDDIKLKTLFEMNDDDFLNKIKEHFPNRKESNCIQRLNKLLEKTSSKARDPKEITDSKHGWSQEEDRFIIDWAHTMGTLSWTKCAKLLKKRTSKDCKERWNTKLSLDNLNDDNKKLWNPKDELLLLYYVKSFGTCWSKILKFFNQEKKEDLLNENIQNKSQFTQNEIKNKFYSIINKFVKFDLEEKNYKMTQEESHLLLNFENGKRSYNFNSKTGFLQFENLWFYIDKAIGNCGKNFTKKALYEIKTEFDKKTCNIEKDINSCLNEMKENLNKLKNSNNNCIIRINLCQSCLQFLRDHIKRKLIIKFNRLKREYISSKNIKEFFEIQEQMIKENNPNNFNENSIESRILNIDKIPKIFDLISNIKKEFS